MKLKRDELLKRKIANKSFAEKIMDKLFVEDYGLLLGCGVFLIGVLILLGFWGVFLAALIKYVFFT